MPFSMAFQPIVNVQTGGVYAYEALVRGPHGEGASTVLSQVTPENRYAFDQSCRREAITLASRLHLQDTGAKLSINFLPGAVYNPAACLRVTISTARQMHFPLDRIIFELTEREEMDAPEHLHAIAEEYEKYGFQIALDDFGAGYANLNVLASLHATVLKLDMDLTRDLSQRPRAQHVVRSMVDLCGLLDVTVVGEGVETLDEYWCMRDCGISLMQGFLFARPAFEALPPVHIPPALRTVATSKPPAAFPTARRIASREKEAEPARMEA